jgi:16S rRNA (uracil1498-N3)-methyltransferase
VPGADAWQPAANPARAPATGFGLILCILCLLPFSPPRDTILVMRRRFFVDRFESNSAALRGDAAEHLGRVLRAEPGQIYELSDGHRVWLAKIERVAISKRGDNRIEFALVEKITAHEPALKIELLLSLIKFDRFEWCIEKATELGSSKIIPLAAARTDKPLVAAAAKRLARWEKITLESAQQSRRLRPPAMSIPVAPEKAFIESSASIKVLLSEKSDAPSLRTVLEEFGSLGSRSGIYPERSRGSSDKTAAQAEGALANEENTSHSVALAIGPEGGWTDAEITAGRAAGFVEASLGENILRTETAVLAAMAILGFALDG